MKFKKKKRLCVCVYAALKYDFSKQLQSFSADVFRLFTLLFALNKSHYHIFAIMTSLSHYCRLQGRKPHSAQKQVKFYHCSETGKVFRI